VNIDKASVHVTVQTQASLLIACNAKGGKCFEMYSEGGIAKQIDIPDYIMSRIDLKVMMVDNSSEAETRDIVSAMMATRRTNKTTKSNHLNPGFIRKYIAHSRKINPELPEEFEEKIANYITDMRKEMGKGGATGLKITPRQTSSIILLAEAHARMRLKSIVEEKDVDAAIKLFDECFRLVNTNPVTGKVDMSFSTLTPLAPSLKYMVFTVIKEIGGDSKTALKTKIFAALKEKGYDEDRVDAAISKLMGEGRLYEPKIGTLQVMK